MSRKTFAIAAMLAALTAETGRADTVPQIVGLPSPALYTPGESFTFSIIVPQIADFSSFNLNLIFDASVNNPNLAVSAAPPGSRYVFPVTTGFSSFSNPGPGQNEVTLNLSDSTNPGVVAIPGTNDTLAVVTVSPGSDLTGPITISVDSSSKLVYDVEGFDNLPGPVTVDQGPPPTPVPTPAAWLSLTIGGVVLAGRNRLRRKEKDEG